MLINKDIFNALIPVNSLSEAGTEQLDVSPMPGRVA